MDTAINPAALAQAPLVEFTRPAQQPLELLQALHAVQAGIDKVDKSGWNEAQRYKYASEADFMETVRPLMNEHGLVFIPNLVGEPHMLQYESKGGAMMFLATVMVQYTIMHAPSGQVLAYPSTVPGTGMDTGDKAVYKALTGANKYFLFKLFQIPTGDDAEAKSPRAYSPGRAPGAEAGGSRGPRPTADCNMGVVEGMGIYLLDSVEFKRTKRGDLYPRYKLLAQRADVTAGQFQEWQTGVSQLGIDINRLSEGSRIQVGKLVVINLTKSGDYWNADKMRPYTKPKPEEPGTDDDDIDLDVDGSAPPPPAAAPRSLPTDDETTERNRKLAAERLDVANAQARNAAPPAADPPPQDNPELPPCEVLKHGQTVNEFVVMSVKLNDKGSYPYLIFELEHAFDDTKKCAAVYYAVAKAAKLLTGPNGEDVTQYTGLIRCKLSTAKNSKSTFSFIEDLQPVLEADDTLEDQQ